MANLRRTSALAVGIVITAALVFIGVFRHPLPKKGSSDYDVDAKFDLSTPPKDVPYSKTNNPHGSHDTHRALSRSPRDTGRPQAAQPPPADPTPQRRHDRLSRDVHRRSRLHILSMASRKRLLPPHRPQDAALDSDMVRLRLVNADQPPAPRKQRFYEDAVVVPRPDDDFGPCGGGNPAAGGGVSLLRKPAAGHLEHVSMVVDGAQLHRRVPCNGPGVSLPVSTCWLEGCWCHVFDANVSWRHIRVHLLPRLGCHQRGLRMARDTTSWVVDDGFRVRGFLRHLGDGSRTNPFDMGGKEERPIPSADPGQVEAFQDEC
ncbi:hypothetical protein CGCTS75_v007739 [Colletotrichum tropicale]|nr:hypothetical protein CGCTS75_v007739 [Colletotrichum tropicale]